MLRRIAYDWVIRTALLLAFLAVLVVVVALRLSAIGEAYRIEGATAADDGQFVNAGDSLSLAVLSGQLALLAFSAGIVLTVVAMGLLLYRTFRLPPPLQATQRVDTAASPWREPDHTDTQTRAALVVAACTVGGLIVQTIVGILQVRGT